jgi:hypothetical protein
MTIKITTEATDIDVYVNGKKVGYVIKCGDYWRGFLYGRKGRIHSLPDYESRAKAVRGVAFSATGHTKRKRSK